MALLEILMTQSSSADDVCPVVIVTVIKGDKQGLAISKL